MTMMRTNWKIALGIAAGVMAGLAGASLLSGRAALAQGGDGGKPVGIAIFKDPSDINSRPYAYILYDSGKVDRKPLTALAGG